MNFQNAEFEHTGAWRKRLRKKGRTARPSSLARSTRHLHRCTAQQSRRRSFEKAAQRAPRGVWAGRPTGDKNSQAATRCTKTRTQSLRNTRVLLTVNRVLKTGCRRAGTRRMPAAKASRTPASKEASKSRAVCRISSPRGEPKKPPHSSCKDRKCYTLQTQLPQPHSSLRKAQLPAALAASKFIKETLPLDRG